jgi:serine protease AprX
VVIELPRTAVRQLAADPAVSYISPDRPVSASGHLSATSGAEQVRSLISGVTLNGKGVTVAVFDSGIASTNNLIQDPQQQNRALITKDFTGTNYYGDFYGHGSHVASLFCGTDVVGNGYYRGVAPGVNLLDMIVLTKDGVGSSSAVINAIDYVISVKSTYNVRVINMSLGTPPKDSYLNDPLCAAVRKAVKAGIVVVCAAGNQGKDAAGTKLYGGIHSPGIDPSVITVGAANTFGTDSRGDDVVATYSSRGPTRGYAVVNGVKKYDNLIKPDLVAPGNKLIGAMSVSQTPSNAIVQTYSTLEIKNGATDSMKTMYLSGTSMAAPVVSGAAALMLQANPKLTPNLVKAILMYTAQPLSGFDTLEQGAGELNIDGAVRLARIVKDPGSLSNGSSLLTTSLPSQQSTVGGTTFKWAQGIVTDYCFLYGSELVTKYQGMYGSGVMLSDATGVSNGVITRNSSLTTGGVSNSKGVVKINSSGVMLSDGVMLADGVMLSDNTYAAGVVISDGVVMADATITVSGQSIALNAYLGDPTACMQPKAP